MLQVCQFSLLSNMRGQFGLFTNEMGQYGYLLPIIGKIRGDKDGCQDFMGGSHNDMVTLENRVRSLERVIEDTARDLLLSSNNRRGGNYMMRFEESGRPLGKYNGFSDYPNLKLGRNDDPMSHPHDQPWRPKSRGS
ncbi:microtubule-associated protein tortifolia1-like protein [Tanacetum coccineum]